MKVLIIIMFTLGVLNSQGQVIYPPGYVGVSVQSGGIVVPVDYVSKSGGNQGNSMWMISGIKALLFYLLTIVFVVIY